MQKVISNLLLTLLISQNLTAQTIDRAPTGKENILPVEGGSILMKIDTVTPLSKLIDKLNDNWEFIETGKGYWIGYTNDMFSIASHGDKAITSLTNFFKTTQNKRGKIGAIYTLHLIGINRQITGRFTEKFEHPNARTALLELLTDKQYTHAIIKLLIRDPWQSDIPYFFKILENEHDDEITWPIVSCLKRYKISELPVNNAIPDRIKSLTIKLKVKNENILEKDFDFNSQIKEALKEFENKFPNAIKIEKELYNQELSKYYRTKLSSSLDINSFLSSLGMKLNSPFSFLEIGCKFQYCAKDEILYFCTIKTAQNLLINWWNKLTREEKEKFN